MMNKVYTNVVYKHSQASTLIDYVKVYIYIFFFSGKVLKYISKRS